MAEKPIRPRRFEPSISYAKEFNTVRDLQKEPAQFLWYQLLTAMIENMNDDQAAIEDMFKYASTQYADNKVKLEQSKKSCEALRSSEKQFDAIRWYTGDSFVSQLVNGALKREDYIVLHRLRAFISRLMNAIKDESQTTKQFWSPRYLLYSGRTLSNDDIERLRAQKGEIIAINGFLSTSFTVEAANAYHENMYFRITTPDNLETVYFAAISHRSEIKDDDEVLFSLSSTFRVGETMYGKLNEYVEGWIVDLTATDDGSSIFKTYLNWRQHYCKSNALTFGHLLVQMGEFDASLNYFDEYCQNEDKMDLLMNKGCAHLRREASGDLEIAKAYLIDALAMASNESTRPSARGSILTNLGILYDRICMYDKALDNFEKAKEFIHDNPYMIAVINNNIGVVYDQGLENYEQAVEYYELALAYYHQFPHHHAYAQTLQNLACALDTCGKHELARNSYLKAKEVYDRTLPSTHPDIMRVLLNIATTYYCEGQYKEAIDINLQAKNLNETESLVEASRLCNLGEIYREKCLFYLAMHYSERGLKQRQRILHQTPEHVDIATALRNIGQIYLAQGLLNKAESSFHEAEKMLFNTLSSDTIKHSPTLAVVYDCLGQLSLERNQSKQALDYGHRARAIFEHKKITTVIDYASCLMTIARAQVQLKDYNTARSYATKALNIFKSHLLVHPSRADVLYHLAHIAEISNELKTARQHIKDALQHLKRISSDNKPLFYKCTNKCAMICFRQKDYNHVYKYLLSWKI